MSYLIWILSIIATGVFFTYIGLFVFNKGLEGFNKLLAYTNMKIKNKLQEVK